MKNVIKNIMKNGKKNGTDIVDCSGIAEDHILGAYASEVAGRKLYYLALRKLADVGVPMRISLLNNAIADSDRAFSRNLKRYENRTVVVTIMRLGKDTRVVKKKKIATNFVTLEITEFGREVLELAEEMKKFV